MNMFTHYFTVAFRQIVRNKSFSAINVLGLSLGMTCCTIIFLWVMDEKSVDNFHEKGDRLYNVYMAVRSNSGVQGVYNTPRNYHDNQLNIAIADAKDVLPEVVGMTYYTEGYTMPWGKPETFKAGEKMHKLEGSRASEDFFTMFSYPLIVGEAKTALKDFSSIAISRKMALLFFDSPEAALGKSIRYENKFDLQVTAVFEDLTSSSSRKFEFLINWQSHVQRMEPASNTINTTLLLAPNANVQHVTAQLNKLAQPRIDKLSGVTVELGLQPYRDQYLKANFVDGIPSGGRIEIRSHF